MYVGEVNVYRVLTEKPERKKYVEDLGVNGKKRVKHNWLAFVNVVRNI
jgi:hypothetical protein